MFDYVSKGKHLKYLLMIVNCSKTWG